MKTDQGEEVFTFTDVLGVVSKYRRLIVIGPLLTLGIFMIAALWLPKKYKVPFVLTIYSRYFQSPLVADFIPGVYDSFEMRSQREGLIRQTLTPEFLDSLGEKYSIYPTFKERRLSLLGNCRSRLKAIGKQWGLYSPGEKPPKNSAAREDLLNHIEVVGVNNDTFQVSFISADPKVTFRVAQDIYAHVFKSLQEARANHLTKTRDAIRKHVEALTFNMMLPPDSQASLQPELVREELTNVRTQIRALSGRYTEEHPRVKDLGDKEQVLLGWLKKSSGNRPDFSSRPGNTLVSGMPTDVANEIYKDLTRKMNYLDVALKSDESRQSDYYATLKPPVYPISPLWPKKSIFALWGLAAGLLGTLFVCFIREYFDRTALHAATLAQQMGINFLGKLPAVPMNTLSKQSHPAVASSLKMLNRG